MIFKQSSLIPVLIQQLNSRRIIFSLLAILGLITPAKSQSDFNKGPYFPIDTAVIFQQLESIERQAIAAVEPVYNELFAAAYTERTERLKSSIRDSTFLFEPNVLAGLHGLVQQIVDANALALEPLVFVSRSPVVNASSYGNGIFVVNIGLLEVMTSREEIALVLAHEIAHDQLMHQHARIMQGVEEAELSERKLKRKMQRRIKQEGLFSVMSEVRNSVYEQHRHGRAAELSADSLGLIYLENTQLNTDVAVKALDHLERENYFSIPADQIGKLLHTTKYPFKLKWIESAATLFGGSFGGTDGEGESTDFWQSDSLSTHPDLEMRKRLLTEMKSEKLAATGNALASTNPYVSWATHEVLNSYLSAGMTAHALVLALKMINNEASDPYYVAIAADALLQTYRAIYEQNFDDAVPPSRHFQDDGANTVVRMLQQMRASEIKKLTLAFLDEKLAIYSTSATLQDVKARADLYFSLNN